MPRIDELSVRELIVLSSVARLGTRALGARIHSDVEHITRRATSPRTICSVLSRLRAKGLVELSDGPRRPNGGRPPQIAALTPAGRQVLTTSGEAHLREMRLVRALLPVGEDG